MADAPDTIVLIHGLWMTPRSWEHWAERYKEQGLQRPRAGLARDGGRSRGDQRRSVTTRDARRRHDRRPLRGDHSRPRQSTDHHGPLVWRRASRRSCSTVASAPPASASPPRPSRVCATCRSRRIRVLGAATRPPVQEVRRTEREAIPLRVREHLEPGGVGQGPRALRRPGAGRGPERGRLRELHAPRRNVRGLREREQSTDAVHRVLRGHVVPPKPIQHMADKYTASTVEYKEFPGRPHFPGAPGWEEVADYALDWAAQHAKTPAAVSEATR